MANTESSHKIRILLFVSSHCYHCPKAEHVAKEVLSEYSEYKIIFEKIRIKTGRGKDLSTQYNVGSVPTILILNEKGEETKRIVGTPSENSLRNEIEKNLGIKKTFFDRILGR